MELLLVRLSITNSVIDPWIYILFRKEVVAVAVNCARRVCQKVEETQRSCSRSATGSKTQGEGLGSVHINPLAEDPWRHIGDFSEKCNDVIIRKRLIIIWLILSDLWKDTVFYAELSQYAGCAHQTFIISYPFSYIIYSGFFKYVMWSCRISACGQILVSIVYFGSFIKFLKDIIS